jgi:ABC-type multidrug transport system permease subunit
MIISSSHGWMNNGFSQIVVGVVLAAFGAYLLVSG